MLKLTHENIWKIKLLQDEKNAIYELIKLAWEKWYELYLFWSRLKWYWADIDIAIKWDISLDELIKLTAKVQKYTDTKLDIIPYKKETSYFFDNILTK